MKAILVFIDGTICDTRHRHRLEGTPEFFRREQILNDMPVPGCIEAIQKLAQQYEIVYIGARPSFTEQSTLEWLEVKGFPGGPVYLAEDQLERLEVTGKLASKYDFLAGIGDRWDDNELHTSLGCLSLILQEHSGEWISIPSRIHEFHQKLVVAQNRVRLEGKVEGLSRVCPLLLSEFGDKLWEVYHAAVLAQAENMRPQHKEEDLELFARFELNPENLADIPKLFQRLDEEDWEKDPLFGLQEREVVEATKNRYSHRVTRCYYAELWKKHGRPEIGYQLHCKTDAAWWDRPAWNPNVRFHQTGTLMQGDTCCTFTLCQPGEGKNNAD